MKNYNKIVVLENDSFELSYLSNEVIKNETNYETWFNFNMDIYRDINKSFEKIKDYVDKNVLFFSNPSFVGYDNMFEGYVTLFYKLMEHNIKLDIAIIYYDGFECMLLNYLSKETNNLRKQRNHEMLKAILDFHNIYEILDYNINDNPLTNVKHITYKLLMNYYLETNKKIGRSICKIITTGEEFEVYSIFYNKDIYDSDVVLYIENDPNNKFKLKDIIKC